MTEICSQTLEDLRHAAIIGVQEADGDVLRGDELAAHVLGAFDSGLEHPLAVEGEGHAGG